MSDSIKQLHLADLLKILGVGILYALLNRITLAYLADNINVSTFWLPSGLALGAVLLGGNRYALSIFFGSLAAEISLPNHSWPLSIGMSVAPTLEALLGAWLLKKVGSFDLGFRHLRDFLQLIVLAGFISVFFGALTGTLTLLTGGFIDPAHFVENLLRWWMGDSLGIILLTPLILVWRQSPEGWLRPARLVEVIVVLGCSMLVGQIIFLDWFPIINSIYAKGFFMFLFVTLAAVRLGTHGTLAVLIMISVQGILGAIHATGYFAHDITDTHLVNYWVYMVTLSIVGITLATYINTENETKETLREQEEFFRMITDNIDDFIAVLDLEGRRLYNSPSYAKLFGDPHILQHTDSFAEVHPDDREHVREVFRQTVESGIGQRIEFRFVLADGSVRFMESRGGLIKNANNQPMHVVVVSHDITERKKIDEKIRSLAFYDALTDLPNRRMLSDRLGQAMASSKRSEKYGALLFLDLDNFKPLNDQYGHNIGDLLLIEVAHRITSCVREIDTVARFGGDEFVVMLSPLLTGKVESTQQAEIVAEKIRVALAEPYKINIKSEDNSTHIIEHHCTASIGVVLFFDHEASEDDIIKWADMAMYRSKEDGRNRIRFYERD